MNIELKMKQSITFITLFIATSFSIKAEDVHWEQVLSATEIWAYVIPKNQPPISWSSISYDASTWLTGQAGIGYGNSDCVTEIPSGTITLLVRKEFNLTNLSQIKGAQLNLIYDDGFVAYLNGVEIVRDNIAGTPPQWDELSITYNEQESKRLAFAINDDLLIQNIQEGTNVLAIEVHNQSSSSSDLSCTPTFFMSFSNDELTYEIPPSWFTPIKKDSVVVGNPLTDYYLSSNLPIIVVNTDATTIVADEKIPAQMGVIYTPDSLNTTQQNYNHFLHTIGIELRGSSSIRFPKKSYGIEFHTPAGEDTSIAIFNIPQEEDWILQGPYTDKSLIRNILAYHLGSEMTPWAPQTQLCELIINEEYMGLYVFMEKIKRDKNRVDIAKLKETDISGEDITGGYIIKIDKNRLEPGFDSEHDAVGDYYNPQYPIRFLYEYPKAKDITVEQEEYIQNYIEAFEDALASNEFKDEFNGYASYINVPSFVDYLIAMETTKNIDGYRISAFLYKDKNEKLSMGPLWDFNFAFGMHQAYESYSPEGWNFDMYNYWTWEDYQLPFWWEKLLKDVNFRNLLGNRWAELRSEQFSTLSLINYIDTLTADIEEAQMRNFDKWPILGFDIDPNQYTFSTYAEEIDYLKDWLTDRLDWLDENMPSPATAIDLEVTKYNVNIYPNPFVTNFSVDIQSWSGSKISVSLYNPVNQLCASFSSTLGENRNLHINMNDFGAVTAHLVSGIYFLKIDIDGVSKTYKIVKL